MTRRIRGARVQYPLAVVVLIAAVAGGIGTGVSATEPTDRSATTARTGGNSAASMTPPQASRSTVAAGEAPDVSAGNESCRPGTGRPDPPADRVGWERGCWYDDPLALRRDDGLNEREVDALVARTMARIETLRGLEFRIDITVELRPRSSFDRGDRTVPRARTLRKNARFEALFVVNESTDAVRRRLGIGGYYAPWDDRIVLVADNATADVHEFELAHELVHALQDDHYPSGESRHLFDRRKARAALIEGVANYVTQDYKRRCRGAWKGTCLPPADWNPGGDGGGDRWCEVDDPGFNLGHHHLGVFPYSDGPPFVASLRERGGWASVAAAYRRPPNSTEQVIHPEKYPTDRPTAVTLRDRSLAGWRVVRPARAGRPAGFRLGEAAMYVMFWYQTFATDHRASIVPCRHAFRADGPRDLYNYSHPVTAGWDGDRLLPYVATAPTTPGRARSTDLGRMGYVWKTAWDRPRDAREFAAAYRDLLAAHGATAVPGRENTYRIPETSGFGDAVYLAVTDATVLVVNAPSVSELRRLRPGAVPRSTRSATDGRPVGPWSARGAVLLGAAALLLAILLLRRMRS